MTCFSSICETKHLPTKKQQRIRNGTAIVARFTLQVDIGLMRALGPSKFNNASYVSHRIKKEQPE